MKELLFDNLGNIFIKNINISKIYNISRDTIVKYVYKINKKKYINTIKFHKILISNKYNISTGNLEYNLLYFYHEKKYNNEYYNYNVNLDIIYKLIHYFNSDEFIYNYYNWKNILIYNNYFNELKLLLLISGTYIDKYIIDVLQDSNNKKCNFIINKDIENLISEINFCINKTKSSKN